MRISFVCAGAEPGHDGVGDYIRRLSKELERCGHNAAILALNDRALEIGIQCGEKELRLSRAMPWSVRMRKAREFLEEFRPDALSLQFVGYGFDSRGLPLGLASRLSALAAGRPWHAMFHELWIEPGGGWGKRVLSRLQKACVVDLCHKLAPKVVHTSNSYYTERLQSAAIPCGGLPLFGNIPVVPQQISRDPDEWVFAFFGSLRRGWEPEPLLTRIAEARVESWRSRCRFVSLGRLGETGEKIWEQMERSDHSNFVFEKRGELPPADISLELQSADFGIAVSPHHLLGKSGAVAAMRDHGLPVIVNRFDSRLAQEVSACQVRDDSCKHANPAPTSRALLAKRENGVGGEMTILLDDHFSQNLATAKRGFCRDSLPEVAEAFLNSLKSLE